MRERILTEDDYNLVMALKQGEQDTLLEDFQVFWDKRCSNGFYLKEGDILKIIRPYVLRILEKNEINYLFEEIERKLIWENQSISLSQMNELFLQSLHGIQMLFD